MAGEFDFLSAIKATPADRSLRKIYADWLEEQGDTRGELIRLEEKMRDLPVFADEYWQRKPRRNELRQNVAAKWMLTMGYGGCSPLFVHGWPDGVKQRWRLIRELVERWELQNMPDVGGRLNEIEECETNLGRTLPDSMREWVSFAHDCNRSESYISVMRDSLTMIELEEFAATSLLLQAEGDYHWAVFHEDFDRADPPVNGFHWDGVVRDLATESEQFIADSKNPLHDSLTTFALSYVMGYLDGSAGGFGVDITNPDELSQQLKRAFPTHCVIENTEIFETDNLLIRLHHWRSRDYLRLEAAAPIQRKDIPDFLLALTNNGGSFSGIFVPK